jgi:hypothetical protein
MQEVQPQTRGARRCLNPDCEFGNRWIVGEMKLLPTGKFTCLGNGCHCVYEPREVIDPGSPDYELFVGS